MFQGTLVQNMVCNARATFLTATFLLTAVVMQCTDAHAEMPPEYYASLQLAAGESLTIHVERVVVRSRKSEEDLVLDVTAYCLVENVERSQSKLISQFCIVINYQRVERVHKILGYSEIPMLHAGRSYPAFLDWDKTKCQFVPAARGYSFQKVFAKPAIIKPGDNS